MMARKDRGHYALKHGNNEKPNKRISKLVKEKAGTGELPCSTAFVIVEELETAPAEVGLALDLLEVPVVQCQLGLFGYKPRKRIVEAAKVISPPLEEAIRRNLVKGRLPCLAAWEIAESLMVSKMSVSRACESMKIKISNCQLGAF